MFLNLRLDEPGVLGKPLRRKETVSVAFLNFIELRVVNCADNFREERNQKQQLITKTS